MENVPPGQDEPENPLPRFWCYICSIACASANNLQSHFMGAKHKRAEEALKTNQEAPKTNQEGDEAPKPNQEGEEALKTDQEAGEGEKINQEPEESLVDQIDACTDAEPILGLEYIYEVRNYVGHNRYECRLCECFLGRNHMFMHIVGARHRIQYLSHHHSYLGITTASIIKGPKKLKRLRQLCFKVEQEYGRKQINVVTGDATLPSFSTRPCLSYQPDNKSKIIDFTNDEFTDVRDTIVNVDKAKAEDEEEEHVVTFLELKTKYGVKQRDKTVGQEGLLQSAAEGSEKDPKGPKDKEKDFDDSCSNLESNADPQAFPTKEELFEYLESFQVFELRDVHFLMKASKKLRNILARHEEIPEATERKKMESGTEDKTVEQSAAPCHTNPHGPTVPEGVQGSVPYPAHSEEENHTESDTVGNQAMVLPANQLHKTNSMSKKPSASPGTGKLSFRISAPPAEKNPLASSELSTMQREFTAKSKRSKMAVSETYEDDMDFTADPESPPLKSVFESNQDFQEPRSSTLSNRGTSVSEPRYLKDQPDRAGAASIRSPFPNEHLQGSPDFKPSRSSYPLERSGNPAGFVTKWPSNEQERFKNVARFPSPLVPNAHEQMRNSAFPYPPRSSNEPLRNSGGMAFTRATGSHEMLRNSAGSGGPRTPQPYRQPYRNPAPSRAPFPQQVNFAPRASPPSLPFGKDDVTAKFFESLKGMEVSEVASTLNKITATNPAFRGIHVPSLIQYLMDTGKLKSSSKK